MNAACEVCHICPLQCCLQTKTGAQPRSPNPIQNCNWTAHSAVISKCRKNGYLESTLTAKTLLSGRIIFPQTRRNSMASFFALVSDSLGKGLAIA